jgi:hypothetical protein
MGIYDRDYMREDYVPRRSRTQRPKGVKPGKAILVSIALLISACLILHWILGSSRDDAPSEVTFPINVNVASKDELMEIPYVGPAIAEGIIACRPYSNIKDLTRVHGIGESSIQRIAEFVTIEDPEIEQSDTPARGD